MASNPPVRQSQSQPSLAEFTSFTSLPAELRIKIWEETFYSRVVELHSEMITIDGVAVQGWVSNSNNPAALSVCSESRSLAQGHFTICLSVFKSPKTSTSILCRRCLLIAPASDLLAILGTVGFFEVVVLFKTIIQLDPTGHGLRRAAMSISIWTQRNILKFWERIPFSQLDELVILMYDEQRPPADFLDGECAVEEVVGMDSLSRALAGLKELFEVQHLRLVNLSFIPGPLSRRGVGLVR